MSYSSMFGSHHMPGRVWRPKIEVTQDNVGMVPPEELIVDPYLPALGVDPFDPAGSVVIPSGRFCSIGYSGGRGSTNYRFTASDTGKTTLTLHDGKNLTPVGMSINQMYKMSGEFMTDSNTVKFKRNFVAEVPYVASINGAHGTLRAGDMVTGYWGSTSSTTSISYLHRGKPVKWNARTIYSVAGPGSAQQTLAAAIYPGIEPTIITQYTSAGVSSTNVTGSVAWNSGLSKWVATFAGAGSAQITEVVYSFGQTEDQIGGEVLRIQSITDILNRDDYLKWVEYAPQDYLNYPPAMQNYPVTQVGTGSDPDVNSDWETPTTVVAGSQYRVANYPVSVLRPFLIAIKGVFIDINGTTVNTTGTWYTLPYNAIPDARGYFNGQYHNVNWRTGLIELGSNISSITAIKVLYAYITDPRDGAVAWGQGILNLTDGRNINNQYGVPSNLNLSDVTGALRIIVK